MLEELRQCKSGALTLDGSKSSNLRTNSLSTSLTIEFLMLLAQRTKKEALLVLMAIKVLARIRDNQTRNGM
jgi:hypothetical protein